MTPPTLLTRSSRVMLSHVAFSHSIALNQKTNALAGTAERSREVFVPTSNLSQELKESGLDLSESIGKNSQMPLLVSLLEQLAIPRSIYLIDSPNGGETSHKTELIVDAISKLLGREVTPEDRVFHVMCYAGTDKQGSPALLNILRHVTGAPTTNKLFTKTGIGGDVAHITLNRDAAAQLIGGFYPLQEGELDRITGMERHEVNILLPTDRFDTNPDLRVCFDPSIFQNFLSDPNYRLIYTELPTGVAGERFSILLPIETFLCLSIKMAQEYPHFELGIDDELSPQGLAQAMSALNDILSHSGLERVLSYNPGRPVMASFNFIISQLTRELSIHAPSMPQQLARRAISNFVRHFFAVEYTLAVEALNCTDAQGLHDCWTRLSKTEFARFLLPLDSFENFSFAVEAERKRKQPVVPIDFSAETFKSELYLQTMQRLAEKLNHAVHAVRRENVPPYQSINRLQTLLEGFCKKLQEHDRSHSLQNIVIDFVDMVFRTHRSMLSKLESKLRCMLAPNEDSDQVAVNYWHRYFQGHPSKVQQTSEYAGGTDHESLIRTAILPEVRILLMLPFAKELFGDEGSFSDGLIAKFQ